MAGAVIGVVVAAGGVTGIRAPPALPPAGFAGVAPGRH
jgi:hypothetical protein